MKFALPALLAVALAFTSGVFVARASAPHLAAAGQCGQFDLKSCDLDGDGMIHLGDVTILALNWNFAVGLPDACVGWQGYGTEVTSYDALGTPVASSGGYYCSCPDSYTRQDDNPGADETVIFD